MTEDNFQKLCDDLDAAAKRRSKERHRAILVAGKDAEREPHPDALAKALVHAHESGAINGRDANQLDLLRRQGKLPARVRSALLSLDTSGGE